MALSGFFFPMWFWMCMSVTGEASLLPMAFYVWLQEQGVFSSVFVVLAWLYGCNKSLGRETPAVFSLQKDREFQLHMKKKESFIFYWNQLHWTFYRVLSGFSFRTSNALFCLHFEIFGCCFNPLIYLPGSAWWGWHLLARKAKRQKVGPSWAESWDCTYCKYFSLSVFIPCQLSDVCQEGKAGFPAQWNVL